MKPSAPTSFTLTKRYPREGSNEVPDQVAPPRVPGTAKVSSSPQGLKMRPGRTAPKFSRQYLFDSGVTVVISSRVMEILASRSEEHTSELQSQSNLVCRLLLE